MEEGLLMRSRLPERESFVTSIAIRFPPPRPESAGRPSHGQLRARKTVEEGGAACK